jgi:ribonuclease HI
MPQFFINCDGSKTPNNDDGISCWGMIVHDDTGQRIYARYGALGKGYTHNQAEYYAVYEALTFACHNQDKRFTIRTDSKLIVDQLTGAAVCQAETLVAVNKACHVLLDVHDHANRPKLVWIPREKNVVADTLTRKAQDYFGKAKHVHALALEAWYVEPWHLIPE